MAPRVRPAVLLVPLLALGLACGGEPDVASAPPEGPADVAGTYRVQGLTTVIGTELSREISGTLVLSQEGDRYTATFSLETLYPSPDGPLPAEVIGQGEGVVKGDTLDGTARTQLVTSRVPGLDSSFAMVPPSYGVRIESNAAGQVTPDGGISFEIENRGAEGEEYVPTVTRVSGVRIAEGDS